MKQYLLYILLFCCLQTTAQNERDKLIGDWKFYLKDNTSFELLQLNADGTGLKCFGQTINHKDTLFLDHFTTLQITEWHIINGSLIINSRNKVSFKINPGYKLSFPENGKIELTGEHLIYYLYPSALNRKEFQRTVIYQRSDKIPAGYGIASANCVSDYRDLFSLKKIDKTTQLAVYKGFDDLVPHIVSCGNGFEYAQKLHDPSYSLIIPATIHKWSFGFGNKDFYISFDSEPGNKSEASIVIYYDFDNEMKDYYFSQIEKGKEQKQIVKCNNIDVYKTLNWQGKYEGKIFLDKSIVVAYYTRDKNLEEKLQQCITSFKYQ